MVDDDEFSDLTDLDELSEEYDTQPAKRKAKAKSKGKAKSSSGWRIHHALPTSRATTYSAEALYKQLHNGDINLDPEYQRDVVWPEAKQIGLIDSIFRNFYVPPVIFAVNAFDDGTETRTCIDGKQRLTSIHRFLEGLIPHKDPKTGEKLWYRDNPAHRTKTAKKILPEKYRKMFDTKAIVCVEYPGLEDADEREIFQRVQLGVALTPAEKLKVLSTPRAHFVRGLQDAFLNSESASLGGGALAWDRSRGSDFRCLAQTIQCIALPKSTSIQATEKWLADPAPMASGFAASIEGTYRVFERLVEEHPKTFTKIAPIEFIAVGILVHRHKAKLTLVGLADAVGALRKNVRAAHDDVRNNSKVYKTMSAFIDGYRGPAVGRNEVCAADEVGEGTGVAVGTSASATTGTKRKAPARESDDSDDDYAPARRAAPRKRTNPMKPPPPAAAPPPAPPTPPMSGSSSSATPGLDAMRAAKEKIEAIKRASAAAAAPSAPSTPFSFNPDAGHAPYGQQQQQVPYAYGQQGPYASGPAYPPQGAAFQQQPPGTPQNGYGHGATGVAATLEANLMGAASWGGTPNGTRVKAEPSAPPPFSAGSTGSGGGQDRYGRGGQGGRGEYDYEGRDHRGREREYDHEYDRDKRYRERDRDRDGGRGGRRW
ncbi:hypothetical protein DFH09DRAFT_1042568 [Mycena vulgaris]|nr:hypothetical protein DFH09DRAFT_1042568 [Mycena vulgaris]